MISVGNLDLTYGHGRTAHHAVRDMSLAIQAGSFYTLLGPSGCGKTTTLRCIAGLERPDAGRIEIGGQVVFDSGSGTFVPPHRRRIGMVFQSYAIWPHLNVFDNVAFPLRRKRPRVKRGEIADRVGRALSLVKLGGLEHRGATDLSGGQQQRLALARALVGEPDVLLLDEPLSNLDAKLREEMRSELKQLTKRLGVTTLFITHEQVEALTMSDRVAVMDHGRIAQEGTPLEIYNRPRDTFVADFVGRTNFIAGTVRGARQNGSGFKIDVDSAFGVVAGYGAARLDTGAEVVLAIRPENIDLRQQQDGASADSHEAGAYNAFQGEVADFAFIGSAVECAVATANGPFKVQVHPARAPKLGTRVSLTVRTDDCRVLGSHS
ncbi:MAG: ABC transporter ATP-binding protein [Rhodospirillaceae bacterium]|nr:ABC transporter ATP-binding protein [Rhodospirillaceae bacterium]